MPLTPHVGAGCAVRRSKSWGWGLERAVGLQDLDDSRCGDRILGECVAIARPPFPSDGLGQGFGGWAAALGWICRAESGDTGHIPVSGFAPDRCWTAILGAAPKGGRSRRPGDLGGPQVLPVDRQDAGPASGGPALWRDQAPDELGRPASARPNLACRNSDVRSDPAWTRWLHPAELAGNKVRIKALMR
jgi:hypothetical protein